jgi:hypothetical protein
LEIEHVDDHLKMIVDAQDIANIVIPGSRKFQIDLFGLKKFGFEPWYQDADREKELIIDPYQAFDIKMNIFEAKKAKGHVKVFFHHDDDRHVHTGGEARITAASYEVRDEKGNEIELERLEEISAEYWKNKED